MHCRQILYHLSHQGSPFTLQILIITVSIYTVPGPDLAPLCASSRLITVNLYNIYYYTHLKVGKLRHRALNNLHRVAQLLWSRVSS